MSKKHLRSLCGLEMSKFNINDNIALIEHGNNVYKIVDISKDCYLLNCIDWKQSEWLSCDASCFRYGDEMWLSVDDMWQFEHVYLTNFEA